MKAAGFSISHHIERKSAKGEKTTAGEKDFDSEVVDDIMKFEDSP